MIIGNRQPLFSRAQLDAVIFELNGMVMDTASLHVPPRVAPGSVRLIQALREHGYRTAVVASRRNGGSILRSAGLEPLFDVRVDGLKAERLDPRGEPVSGDAFLYAAGLLQVSPRRCAVVADTLASIDVARASGFGLVLALTHSDEPHQRYLERGANGVFAELADLAETAAAELNCQPRRAAMLSSALAALPEILQARKDGLLMLLDYDGTLTPIVDRPELAVLAPETRATLCNLVSVMPVAVVSGRELGTLRALVDVPGLVYVGNHGFDMADLAGESHQLKAVLDYLPVLDAVEQRLHESLAIVAGALLERKRSSVAVHFRLVAESDIPQVQARVREVLSAYPQLKVTPGKKVIEIQPGLDWDKGKAVEWLLPQIDADGRRHPIYIGDDTTDENAFRVVCGRGTGILVREDDHPTAARYALENPEEVRLFLQRLTQALKDD